MELKEEFLKWAATTEGRADLAEAYSYRHNVSPKRAAQAVTSMLARGDVGLPELIMCAKEVLPEKCSLSYEQLSSLTR